MITQRLTRASILMYVREKAMSLQNALVVGALFLEVQGVPKKGTNRMLLEPRCTSSITSSRHPLEMFFARFLLRLSRLKRSQDILMGQFGPTALNFCYYFYLLVLFWDTQ